VELINLVYVPLPNLSGRLFENSDEVKWENLSRQSPKVLRGRIALALEAEVIRTRGG
jgi:hypothetical protein